MAGVSGDLCSRCAASPLAVEHIQSAYQYEGVLREAIHALKYQRVKALGHVLGRLLAQQVPRPDTLDAVIPVPMSLERMAQRGYNHAALLAESACTEWGIPDLYRDDLLARVRQDQRQAELSAVDRRVNVRHAFQSIGPNLASYRILIIDDICTTGSTLDACAQALLSHGANQVAAVTLARAGHL